MKPYLVAEEDAPRGNVILPRVMGCPTGDEPPLTMYPGYTVLEDVRKGDRLLPVEGVPGAVVVDRHWQDIVHSPGCDAMTLYGGRCNCGYEGRKLMAKEGAEAERLRAALAEFPPLPWPLSFNPRYSQPLITEPCYPAPDPNAERDADLAAKVKAGQMPGQFKP